jgi:tetratricopeptide (TPR) repeat protein
MKLASNDASAYLTLGNTFQALRRLDDAVTAIRRALEIDPQLVGALNNLGVVLTDQGKRDEAMANYRRALEIEPRSAPAVLNLGGLLAERGELEPALALFRDAERIFADDPSPFGRAWLERSREVIALAEKGLARLPALSEVLDGRRAVSSEEWNAAVQFGYDQKRYREVVALTESTLRDAPELIGGFYGAYFPACVAALLAAEGEVAGIATDERARLREEARVWLTREAERCITQLDTGGSDAEDCRDFLKHVQEDPDLASVRGGAIDALPESERMAWRALWKRIVEGAAK